MQIMFYWEITQQRKSVSFSEGHWGGGLFLAILKEFVQKYSKLGMKR